MAAAALSEYSSQLSVAALFNHAGELDNVLQNGIGRNEDVAQTVKLTRTETMRKSMGMADRRKDYVQRMYGEIDESVLRPSSTSGSGFRGSASSLTQ